MNKDENNDNFLESPAILRNSYSQINALRFKDAFDKAIESKEDVFIPASDSGMKLNTLRNRASEALLWLTRETDKCLKNNKYTNRDYLVLRSCIKLKIELEFPMGGKFEEGVIIHFSGGRKLRSERIEKLVVERQIELNPVNENWREKLVEWIENKDGQQKDVFFLNKLLLSFDDQRWVKEMLNRSEIENVVNSESIRASR